MCLADGLPKRDRSLEARPPARRERGRIQPLTWIVAVAVAPVLLYDVWQTVQDVKQRHIARGTYTAVNLGSPGAARRGLSY